MFALFSGNTDENLDLGIDALQAVRPTVAELKTLMEESAANDFGIDWGQIADLTLPGFPKVAEWERRDVDPWQHFDDPQVWGPLGDAVAAGDFPTPTWPTPQPR